MAEKETGFGPDVKIGIADAGSNADINPLRAGFPTPKGRGWAGDGDPPARLILGPITTYCNPPDENGVRLAMPEDWAAIPPGAHAYLYVTPAFIRASDLVTRIVRDWDRETGANPVVGYFVVRAEGR